MKSLIKWIGYIFFPYISVFWIWAKHKWSMFSRIAFTAWAIFALIIGITSASSGGASSSTAVVSAPPATTTNATSNKTTKPPKSKPVVSTPTKPVKWMTIKTWSGDAIGNTESFTVGDKWRIVWTAKPGKMGAANFAIDVKQSGNDMPVDTVGNVIGKGQETSYESGAGTYYLSILADEDYTISVQTKVSSKPSQPSYRWTNVSQVSGQSMKTSAPFTVKAPWRIVWKSSPGSIGAANFSADVVSHSSAAIPDSSFANVIGSDSGTDYEYSSGTFSLKVLADENYNIEIQQGK